MQLTSMLGLSGQCFAPLTRSTAPAPTSDAGSVHASGCGLRFIAIVKLPIGPTAYSRLQPAASPVIFCMWAFRM